MTKVAWKENKVISIETKENVFVLAQMLCSPYLLIFNYFCRGGEWKNIELSNESILLCKAVSKQFLKLSNVNVEKNIEPLINPVLPTLWIRSNPDSYMAKIWEGTKDEMEFFMIGKGGGSLVEMKIYDKGMDSQKTLKPVIALDDSDVIDKCEVDEIVLYPSFNERLYLCYKFGKNVSPEKDLIFGRFLPSDYKIYFQIISGKVKISEFGY